MRYIISLILILASTQITQACEICGCSTGNYFIGPTPQFSRHFVGIRSSVRSFSTVLHHDEEEFSEDLYTTTEVWGGVRIRRKFQVWGFVPYNINKVISDDGAIRTRGLGDMTLIGNYKLLDRKGLTKDTLSRSHQLWIGLGTKLPTGAFRPDTAELVPSANTQPGTGSYDFLCNASYNLLIDNWGYTANLMYKINRTATDFKFGNRLSFAAFAFYSFTRQQRSFSPNLGLQFENLEPSKFQNQVVESTGGYAVTGSLGAEARLDRVALGCNAQLPVFGSIAEGQTSVRFRAMAHISYAF
jgi:hypothetical protein